MKKIKLLSLTLLPITTLPFVASACSWLEGIFLTDDIQSSKVLTTDPNPVTFEKLNFKAADDPSVLAKANELQNQYNANFGLLKEETKKYTPSITTLNYNTYWKPWVEAISDLEQVKDNYIYYRNFPIYRRSVESYVASSITSINNDDTNNILKSLIKPYMIDTCDFVGFSAKIKELKLNSKSSEALESQSKLLKNVKELIVNNKDLVFDETHSYKANLDNLAMINEVKDDDKLKALRQHLVYFGSISGTADDNKNQVLKFGDYQINQSQKESLKNTIENDFGLKYFDLNSINLQTNMSKYLYECQMKYALDRMIGPTNYFNFTAPNHNHKSWSYHISDTDIVTDVQISYRNRVSEYQAIKNRFVNAIAQNISDEFDEKQKIRAAHNYICAYLNYDFEGVQKEMNIPESEVINYSSTYTMRSPYLYVDADYEKDKINKGVCEAYARSLSLMLTYLDIPCYYIPGDVYEINDKTKREDNPEGHAWNLVYNKKKNKYDFIDCTWDDNTWTKKKIAKANEFKISNEILLPFNNTYYMKDWSVFKDEKTLASEKCSRNIELSEMMLQKFYENIGKTSNYPQIKNMHSYDKIS